MSTKTAPRARSGAGQTNKRKQKAGGHSIREHLYLPLCFLSYFLLDFSFRAIYGGFGVTPLLDKIPLLFTFGWSLLLSAAAFLLPGIWKRLYLLLTISCFSLLALAHGVLINLFKRFFSFSDLAFAGVGAEFADLSYIEIRKLTLLCLFAVVGMMVLAAVLAPRRRTRLGSRRALAGVAAALIGILVIAGTRFLFLRSPDVVRWDNSSQAASIYETFTDTKKSLPLAGLYQYTYRDFCRTYLGNLSVSSEAAEARAELDAYFNSPSLQPEENEMTGIFAGKNLILIQLEAIDTWMLTEETMPNLCRIRQESIDFVNHYSPAYITAGTFNTEFIVNTGLIPPANGVSTTAYIKNSFPFSLPHLFEKAGYSANSFHGSPGEVYDREAIHLNWGYACYSSGAAMGMQDYTMDSQMMSGYDFMIPEAPFFDLIITYSGHGPYTGESSASLAHYAKMKELTGSEDEIYVHALAHARETDLFIGALYDRLAAEGRLQDTVLIFYSDHYNYYIMNDALVMQYKGVDNLNMLQNTPFFLYAEGRDPEQITKVTSSQDILPTIVNLFGLRADPAYFAGSDAFGTEGGSVFFADGSWYDGTQYHDSAQAPETEYEQDMAARIEQLVTLSRQILVSDYFASWEESESGSDS